MWRLGLQQLQQQPAALQTRVDTPQERTTAANTETPALSSPEPQREAAAAAAAAAAKEEAATATAAPAETEGAAATATATTTTAAAAAAADAAAEKCFKLHFCDETNEPEDVCNAQWLVVRKYQNNI
ncbi:erv1 / Alr family domain-containing protein, putative [Eimeria praecox]|uniref:Erv1 / Alr family domain-containing protein, putative n=1 Tax=Eimeria praecox TaxID=51316 RepID=U6H1Z4_9EIME|nr:erv1 / Alr family domain-containing protein, putative [Eimeria praecox]